MGTTIKYDLYTIISHIAFPDDLTSPLAFPHYFRDSYLSALVPYALARDQSQAPERSPGPGGRPLPVIKRQPMDALYVRSVDEQRRARWNPIDRGHKMTVKQYERLTRHDPSAEVRFISCRIRFILLTVHTAGKNIERVIGTLGLSLLA